MSFNSYLLSLVVKNKLFASNIDSLATHYHILSVFYLGLALTFIIWLFELITCNCFQLYCTYSLCFISLTGFILACLALMKGHQNAAGTIVMIYIHLANLTAGFYLDLPMPALLGSFSYLDFCYFLTKSSTVVAINNFLAVFEFYFYIKKILVIFEVTLTPEQDVQIMSGILALICVLALTGLLNYFQKDIECNLWRLLNENYQKSQNLTKEVVHVINSKDTFVSSLSHEVRNVLNSLNGSVDYLLSVLKDSQHLQTLKNARMSGEILFNLVSNALDAAKIRADQLELSYGHANFEDIVQKVFGVNSENFKSKNIFAKAFIDSHIPKNLWIDSGRILQILMNLISNSIKFTPNGGQIRIDAVWIKAEDQQQLPQNLLNPLGDDDSFREISHYHAPPSSSIPTQHSEDNSEDKSVLEFSLEEEDHHHRNLSKLQNFPPFKCRKSRRSGNILYNSESWQIQMNNAPPSTDHQIEPSHNPHESGFLKIQVSDTGRGIPKDSLPQIFDMYIKADNVRSSNSGGTGLGLWICKQLCHKMQGDIAVSSQIDVGTKFVFYIPADNFQQNSEGRIVRDKVHALVVDDYDFNRDLHKLLLEREGVHVTLAENGKEAVEKFKEKGEGFFDFVFMDINMPVMDGFCATKEIRHWEIENRRKRVMIYFVSGEYFNDDDVVEIVKTTGGLEETADIRFIRKPIEVETVTKLVKYHKLGDGKRSLHS